MTRHLQILPQHRIQSMSAAILLAMLLSTPTLRAQTPTSIPEEIEWTWEVRPPNPNPSLPNVLLLGDSISRSYFPQVTKDLTGKANVYLMASSTAVGDPRLPRQIAEFAILENVSFAVIHFNNGMHGWKYTEPQYKAALPDLLSAVRALPGRARLIWANTTPVKSDTSDAATNGRVDARNAAAAAVFAADHLPTDDLHTLMSKHRDLYQDNVHFNDAGAALMGDQAAALIQQTLSSAPH